MQPSAFRSTYPEYRWATLAVIVGAIVYRFVIYFALAVGLNPNDMKLVSAILVVLALLLPRWGLLKRVPSLRQRKRHPVSA